MLEILGNIGSLYKITILVALVSRVAVVTVLFPAGTIKSKSTTNQLLLFCKQT